MEDQRVCLTCNVGLMELDGECVADCPRYYLANFDATKCYHLDALDVKLIYFPFLIVSATFFLLSVVGAQ